jgi:hypothetical protein
MFPQAAVDLIRCDHPPTSRYTLLAHVGMLLDTAGLSRPGLSLRSWWNTRLPGSSLLQSPDLKLTHSLSGGSTSEYRCPQ